MHVSAVGMDQPTFKLCHPVTNKFFHLIFLYFPLSLYTVIENSIFKAE